MAKKLIFKNAEAARDAIMDSQKKEIAKLYENWADEIGERAKFYSHKSTASAPVSERYYKELKKQLRATSQQVSNEVYSKIKSNMYTISDAVVADNVEWLKSFGFNEKGLNAAFSYVPDSVVRNLVTGQIYEGGWNLSSRIWGDNEQTLKDAYQIMGRGLAMNKPIYEIAKDLETYVRPSAKKNWNPVLAMKNTKTGKIEYKKIYKNQVDYNAQRLARTLAQHSYQQSFVATTINNPFITDYIWHSNGSRVCELCKARDGMHFKKNELPMDHPNGMCVMEPTVAEDMADQLANWVISPDGTYPEIDAFAGNFGYEAKTSKFDLVTFRNKFGNVNNNNIAQVLKSKLSKEEYSEWFSLQKKVKNDLGYGPMSGKDFWADFSSGKVKSKELEDFFAKIEGKSKMYTIDDYIAKYGTSAKTPSSWYYSMSPAQKAEAKLLKEASGLGWDEWYEKNLYSGSADDLTKWKAEKAAKKAAKKAKTGTAKVASKIDDAIDMTEDEIKNAVEKYMFVGDKESAKTIEKFLKSNGLNLDDFKNNGDYDIFKLDNAIKKKYSKDSSYITDYNVVKWDDTLRTTQSQQAFVDGLRKAEDNWESLLTSKEKDAVYSYTRESLKNCYKQQNGYLRFGMDVDDEVKETVGYIKSALGKSTTTEDMILIRGTRKSLYTDIFTGDLKKALDNDDIDSMLGQVFKDPGFLSTTPVSGGEFSGDLKFKIYAPAGTKGGYIEKNNHFGEKEFLLQSDTTFIVENAKRDEISGDLIMYLRVIV